MKLPSILFALLSFQATAPAAEPTARSIQADIYPHGLYPSTAARDPANNRTRAVGGYDVLTNLTRVTGLQTDAVEGSASGSNYIFSNLRITSGQTTFDDYLIGYYTFDLATQRLAPTRFERARAVGIFEPKERFFIKDNTAPVNFFTNPATPAQFAQGVFHTFQSGVDYYSNLTTAQRVSFRLSGMPTNQLFRLILTKEDGTTYSDTRVNFGNFGGSVIISRLAILLPGKYRMRIQAVTPTAAFNFGIRFYNENSAVTSPAVSGNTLTASLGGNASGAGLPYKKFKISLTSGQTVSILGDLDTDTYLINSRGSTVSAGGNTGLNKIVTESGDYFIIITPNDSVNSASESYSGVLTITNSLSFLNWGSSYGLPFGKDGAEQDADGDGIKNLLEYALGLNPRKSESTAPLSPAVTATQFAINYDRPNYLQGVTVQPQFSANLVDWVNITGTSIGTGGGKTLMTAKTSRSSSTRNGNARILVTQTP